MDTTAPSAPRSLTSLSLPVAAAIGAFGVIYGATAADVLGPSLAIVSSVVLFSGAAAFSMVALIAAGATPLGVLSAVAVLALRHVPLGAIVGDRLPPGRIRRALVSWFLIDETVGLALTVPGSPERTLVVSGTWAYATWVLGTVIGVAGGAVTPGVEALADALFPVLFIGLAGLIATTRSDSVRACAAGTLSAALLWLWPAAGALGVICVAVLAATVVTKS